MSYNELSKKLEIFFPTKDRDEGLIKCIDSILAYCPDCLITIANCSTDKEKTSEILKKYGEKVKEIILSEKTSISESFQILIKNVSREYCLWLSDDVEIVRDFNEPLIKFSENNNLKVIGIPMIDIMDFDTNYPVDSNGCAVWIRKNLRVGHFAFIKIESLKEVSKGIQPYIQIDLAVHDSIVNQNNYVFLEGEPYLKHHRINDTTRKNRKL